MQKIIRSRASLSPTSTSSTEPHLNISSLVSEESKRATAEVLEAYECQKCAEWFVEPLKVMVVHRYDTARINDQQTFLVEWLDKVAVCSDCYGAFLEVETKVGFTDSMEMTERLLKEEF